MKSILCLKILVYRDNLLNLCQDLKKVFGLRIKIYWLFLMKFNCCTIPISLNTNLLKLWLIKISKSLQLMNLNKF